MVEKTDAWTENVNFQKLSILFDSFKIVIPDDSFQVSFIRNFLKESKLKEFVSEIRSLANRIVLCKHIMDKDKKNGTVYVYRVVVKYTERQTIIEETDRGEELDFFHRKNDNLIKVILIEGGSSDVTETKRTVKRKYEKFFRFQSIHLHHKSEHFAEVAKLIAHKKISPFIQFVMSVRNSIPIDHIGDIVANAVNRALSKASITQLCFEAVIEESGNINSAPYICRSNSTVERLKKELVQKTLESVSNYLGEDICKEMERHIVSDIKSKFNIDVNPFTKFLEISALILLQSVLTVIAAIINPFAGVIVGIVSAVGTFIITVNVNSEAWRRDVASEIYENVSKNKQNVIRDVTANIKERCKHTIDQLDNIAKHLEVFRMRIDLSD